MKKLLTLILLVVSNAWSADELDYSLAGWGSGGGNAIVCFEKVQGGLPPEFSDKSKSHEIPDHLLKNIKSIEIFDLYEAKLNRGFSTSKPEIVEIGKQESYKEYINRIAERFVSDVNSISNILSEAQKFIPLNNFHFHRFAVKQQNDIDQMINMNPSCVFSTMAAQVNYEGYFEVHIDQRLFDHPAHSKQSKATLLIHEMIYAYNRKKYDDQTSSRARKLIQYLIAKHESYTVNKIVNAFFDLGYTDEESYNDLGHNRFNKVYLNTNFYGMLNHIIFELDLPHLLRKIYTDFDNKFKQSELMKKIQADFPNINQVVVDSSGDSIQFNNLNRNFIALFSKGTDLATKYMEQVAVFLDKREASIQDMLSMVMAKQYRNYETIVSRYLTNEELKSLEDRFTKMYPNFFARISYPKPYDGQLWYYINRYLQESGQEASPEENIRWFSLYDILEVPMYMDILMMYLHEQSVVEAHEGDCPDGVCAYLIPTILLDKVID